ncbi:transpeptidase involved in peptidoglycan synthesis (penicillin-binding protein 2) [Haemophilus influenzae]|uniref:Transpeptidase involved in peptidoglycan synthesis (Penicillin-binding protein 2) n=1 Tax=Haemophilus influenzae TaxID=727 RepID=A0A2X1PPA3_HAEIF|nr:transpeptidase involved in peptidoglycan synthesis (penicillin-binding protein 2) [Haemophilus influenzae]
MIFARPLYSRATQGAYPPASTVKPFIAVAAQTENVITPNTTIFDPGYWVLPNSTKRFRDWKKTGHGDTDLNKAITESSDTYFYQVAYNMGIDRLSNWMKDFGFGMQRGLKFKKKRLPIYQLENGNKNVINALGVPRRYDFGLGLVKVIGRQHHYK